jgi:hypothetical protein
MSKELGCKFDVSKVEYRYTWARNIQLKCLDKPSLKFTLLCFLNTNMTLLMVISHITRGISR